MANHIKINKKRLLTKSQKIVQRNVNHLSDKALLKIVNRYNINKKLKGVFERLGKRTTFTNTELDDAIKLYELTIDELQKLAKKRGIKNFNSLIEDQLYYVLISSNKSPLENEYIEYMNRKFKSDLKERLNHVLFLMTKLKNKVTNKEKKYNKRNKKFIK